jgi:hypothetical protein
MTEPSFEWGIPRFGVSNPVTPWALLAYLTTAGVILLSGLAMTNGARLLLGLAWAALSLVGIDAFGSRSAIPSLNGEPRPLWGALDSVEA